MSFVRIMVHCVWATKCREKILLEEQRRLLITHINENAKKKDIFIDTINGYTDHLHSLISLGADQSISKVMQLIKGEASHWANNGRLFHSTLEWADEYYAASVSESQLQKVRAYIANQEEHHKKITFQEEYDEFIKSFPKFPSNKKP